MDFHGVSDFVLRFVYLELVEESMGLWLRAWRLLSCQYHEMVGGNVRGFRSRTPYQFVEGTSHNRKYVSVFRTWWGPSLSAIRFWKAGK